jgi:quercetin dioxygenase-like cupin family protein
MPAIGKPIVLPAGDSMELLETAAASNGECVRARLVFAANSPRAPRHVHPLQDETYAVISGTLSYILGRKKHIAPAGSIIHLPRNIPHQHFCEGPEDVVTIQTVTPALDFDYVLENVFGRGTEDKLRGIPQILQGLVMIRKMKAAFFLAAVPLWVQRLAAWLVAPVAYLFGYRAVYQRFSGEEW